MQQTGFNPWVGKIPWGRERLPSPVFWPGEFHGLYSPSGCNQIQLRNFHFTESEYPMFYFSLPHTKTYTQMQFNNSINEHILQKYKHLLMYIQSKFLPNLTLSRTNLNTCSTGDLFSVQFSRSVVSYSATLWIAACQANLSITSSWSSLRLMSIESVMPSSHLILCHPLFLLPPIPPSIRVFSKESTLRMRWPKY